MLFSPRTTAWRAASLPRCRTGPFRPRRARRTGRRPGGAQPGCARHADDLDLERRSRPRHKAAEVALALAGGTAPDKIDGAVMFDGGAKHVKMNAVFLNRQRSPRTTNEVIDAGWSRRKPRARALPRARSRHAIDRQNSRNLQHQHCHAAAGAAAWQHARQVAGPHGACRAS